MDIRYLEHLKKKYEYIADKGFNSGPISVSGVSLELDDKHKGCIGLYYKELMMQTSSIEEMQEVAKQFDFLATDARIALRDMNDYDFKVLQCIFKQGNEADMDDYLVKRYSSVIIPKVMLHAYAIAKEFTIPEYYAATQYMLAMIQKAMIEEVKVENWRN